MPFPLGAARRRDPGLSESELTTVADRCATDGLCAMGLRFSEDKLSPGERFATLKERLGDAFEVIDIDSGPTNQHGFGKAAHSVLTDEVREIDGHPAYEARKRVVNSSPSGSPSGPLGRPPRTGEILGEICCLGDAFGGCRHPGGKVASSDCVLRRQDSAQVCDERFPGGGG